MTKSIWTCKCGWIGELDKGYRWTIQLEPSGEVLGPYYSLVQTISSMASRPFGQEVTVTVQAKCPTCGTWDMKKEDVPDDD